MLILSERIHQAWKKGEVFSAILMDVSGAFNNVHHERLIHNMRKRKIPIQITNWISSFLSGRTTRMRFNGITTEYIPTPTGIPQRSPLSRILYMLYNSDLLDIPGREQLGLGFIDDILYGVQGKTAIANTKKLEQTGLPVPYILEPYRTVPSICEPNRLPARNFRARAEPNRGPNARAR